MATTSAHPNGRAAAAASGRPSLATVTTAAKKLPTRAILHAIPKWGKTSWAAHAPRPVFVMTRGEDGLLTLIDNGLVPPTDHFPDPVCSWPDLMHAFRELETQPHEFRTVVVDTLNGAERLAQEQACNDCCGGDWEKFDAFGRGAKFTLPLMIQFTAALDRLRAKGMGIILLSHSQVKTFRNPQGPDYDRWEPTLTFKESWSHIDRWADMILFGAFSVTTEQKSGAKSGDKAKGFGGQKRLLMTERTASYDAGNRVGLPPQIGCGANAAAAWANFAAAAKAARQQAAAAQSSQSVEEKPEDAEQQEQEQEQEQQQQQQD